MIIKIIEVFIFLWFIHALADFAFQSDAMAQGKNRQNEERQLHWFWWLSAHALIHGGLLYLLFDNIWLFLIEVITHFTIDFLKCDNKLNPHQDQILHITLKMFYAILIVGGIF